MIEIDRESFFNYETICELISLVSGADLFVKLVRFIYLYDRIICFIIQEGTFSAHPVYALLCCG